MNNMNDLNIMSNFMNSNMNNNMNDMNYNMNDMNNLMNQMINNINNINNQMNKNNNKYEYDHHKLFNNINFNLNIINNNLNNIINCLNNINSLLLMKIDYYSITINSIKNFIKQNIQIENQIYLNNNTIKSMINKKLEYVDYFPGNNNRRINIGFDKPNSLCINIIVPINIKVKDLLLTYANKMEINQNLLGKDIYFLYNGYKLNINEDKDLPSFGLKDGDKIIVVDSKVKIGGNSIN